MTWNSRLLSHPLLSPWTEDYLGGAFESEVPRSVISNGVSLTLVILYRLSSSVLLDLIEAGKADYAALVACSNTFNREIVLSGRQELHELTLDAGDYAKRIVITPYVVATQGIPHFASDEHDEEIRELNPRGFNLPTGSILAVGDSTRVELEQGSPFSVIDLVPNLGTEEGTFDVDLNSDRVKIYLHPEDKGYVERFRKQAFEGAGQVSLYPSIYLHAVAEALRNLSEYPETDWAHTMQDALTRLDVAIDPDDLRVNSLKYAQKLMARPVGRLLAVLTAQDEGE